jgi:hypothetical protein
MRRVGYCSGKALTLSSGCSESEFQPGHRISKEECYSRVMPRM